MGPVSIDTREEEIRQKLEKLADEGVVGRERGR